MSRGIYPFCVKGSSRETLSSSPDRVGEFKPVKGKPSQKGGVGKKRYTKSRNSRKRREECRWWNQTLPPTHPARGGPPFSRLFRKRSETRRRRTVTLRQGKDRRLRWGRTLTWCSSLLRRPVCLRETRSPGFTRVTRKDEFLRTVLTQERRLANSPDPTVPPPPSPAEELSQEKLLFLSSKVSSK